MPHGFYVAEMTAGGEVSPLFGLLGSTIITNIVWLLGFPVLISMAAYCIAGSWLSYQQRPRSDRPNLLTPLQYGLLFKLLSAPGPASTYEVGAYIARRRPRVPAPAFFTHGFALVVAVLGLTYLISLADLWLHAASTVALLLPPFSPAHGPDPDPDFPHQAFSGGSPPHPAAPRLRGHYPLAPALAYLVLLYAHALLAAVLTLRVACLRSPALSLGPASSTYSSYPRSAHNAEAGVAGQRRDGHTTTTTSMTATYPAPRPPTVLRLAQLHLTDALAPVAARLSSRRTPPVHPHHTPHSLFVEDLNTARVEVGVWAPSESHSSHGGNTGGKAGGKDGGRRKSRWGSTSGEGVFGVYKKVVASRGEIY
ncbi:hypothetical protein DFH08DRAFT_898300 [Mycena albidolilacea]|uniref:Uncharacterized protein n=1 Tax=Mycena albidolilacea TaxID=1033008 RepID=A0AAD6Z7U8_9AGAR|nr:hypothetical protein DFH08DRAFT_898300 [Mycena albidolilacea]